VLRLLHPPEQKEPAKPAEGTRRVAVTVTKPTHRASTGEREIVITFLQGGHNGGDIHFATMACYHLHRRCHEPEPADELNTGQDISDLLSSTCGST